MFQIVETSEKKNNGVVGSVRRVYEQDKSVSGVNAAERCRALQNAAERCGTQQDAAERYRTLQNAAERTRTLQNAAE